MPSLHASFLTVSVLALSANAQGTPPQQAQPQLQLTLVVDSWKKPTEGAGGARQR